MQGTKSMKSFVGARNSVAPQPPNPPQSPFKQGQDIKEVQDVRLDRLAAQSLKVKGKVKAHSQPSKSSAPFSGYDFNPENSPTAFKSSQHLQSQKLPISEYRDIFDDTTVTSGFDQTKSDFDLDENDQQEDGRTERGDEDDYNQDEHEHEHEREDMETHRVELPRHPVQADYHMPHAQRLPIITAKKQEQHLPSGQNAIIGRFQTLENHDHTIERAGQGKIIRDKSPIGSKKRNRSYDCPAGFRDEDMGSQPRGRSRDSYTETDLTSTSLTDADRLSPDYNDDELRAMNYSELKSQPFEETPKSRGTTDAQEGLVLLLNLPLEKQIHLLAENLEKPDPSADEEYQTPSQAQAAAFFGQLSIAKWQESGDIFLGKFGEILTKLREARDKKRALSNKFETSIENWEKVIRAQSDMLDRDFEDMRAGGEGVLKGKNI